VGEFYTGFVAEHYDLLVPEDETRTYALFRSFVEDHGQPALELACGTGRPLLDFAAAGLDVEGLDSSPDMLARCRAKAAALGLGVRLHQQRMESFTIDRAFRTIYCTSSSFMLLPDDDAAARALAAVHRHLEPGGRFVAALHLPGDFADGSRSQWRVAREARRPEDGATIRCLSQPLEVSAEKRTYETLLRYQSIAGDTLAHEEDRVFLLHWHTQEQFAKLLVSAGFVDVQALRGNGKASEPSDRLFTFVAARAR
jgi:SAM-dependent methyltransferase